jgi:transposase-like protein
MEKPVSPGFRCYHCGSTNARKDGSAGKKQRLHCRDCGRRFLPDADLEKMLAVKNRPRAACYHCGSTETAKAGFSKFGGRIKQKYFCYGCRRRFRENPDYIQGPGKNRNFWVRKNLPSASHLILELKAFAQRLGRTPQARDIIERSKQGRGNPLNTFRAVFGTYTEAVRRAGLTRDYPRVYPPEQILAELRALRKKLGRSLSNGDIAAASKKGKAPSFYFLRRAFGTVGKAIDAAGAGRKSYNRREIIDFLRKLEAELDRPVRESDIAALYHEDKGPSPTAVSRTFGGIAKARKTAGLRAKHAGRGAEPPGPKTKPAGRPRPVREGVYKYTVDELIAQLKDLGKKLGRPPTRADIDRAHKDKLCASSTTFYLRFGGLLEAYRRAGLKKTNERRRYTDEEIIAAVRQLKGKLGRFPGDEDLRKASKAGKCPTANTVTKYLGKLTEIKSRLFPNEL